MKVDLDSHGFLGLSTKEAIHEVRNVAIQVGTEYLEIEMAENETQSISICTGGRPLRILPEAANKVVIEVE